MEAVWDEFLTERDRAVFAKAGHGQRAGFRDRPCLLIIDINYAFVGDRPEDILVSVERFRNSCGRAGWDAMAKLVPVLDAARSRGIPVLYTTSDPRYPELTLKSWGFKNRRVNEPVDASIEVESNRIPDMIEPQQGETVIYKKKPSAFFGTPLIQLLISHEVNQIICCGTSTSGCVRASVIDAFSHNYRVAVIEDCTFDRGEASHAINLFDMNAKYADVVRSEEVIQYLQGIEPWYDRSTAVDGASRASVER